MDFPYRGAQNALLPTRQWTGVGEEVMGLAMNPLQLLIILAIVAMIFGTKKLKDVGSDLGGAIKSFKKAMNTGEDEEPAPKQLTREDEPKQ